MTGVRELGAGPAVTIAALPKGLAVDEQLAAADTTIRRTRPWFLVLIHGGTRSTALDALLPALRHAGSPHLVLVVGPTGPIPTQRSTGGVPDGFDGLLALDPRRARSGLWPAVDLIHTRRREDTVPDLHRMLAQYDELDPDLAMPSPTTIVSDAVLAARAQALHRYLSQPFRTAEPHTATPAEWTTPAELRLEVTACWTTTDCRYALRVRTPNITFQRAGRTAA